MPKAAVLMKTLAAGAQLWHKRAMGPELDLKQASRETLLAVIAEQRGVIAEQQDTIAQMGKRVEGPGSPAVRRWPGGQDAGPQAGRQAQEAVGTGEEAAQKASPRLCPAPDGTHAAGGPRPGVLPRMPHHPERGMGAADPGGHRDSGGPGGGHGARLHGSDVSVMPETGLPREPLQGVAVGRQQLGVIWSVRSSPCGKRGGCR